MNQRWIRLVIGVCVVAALGAGCRGGKKTGVNDLEGLGPAESIGEYGMGERFGEGDRVAVGQFDNVQFGYDSFRIDSSEIPKIEAVAEYMRSSPGVRLVTEGHCDERGSREYNLSLGEHRALAVRAYLIGLGIEGARIQTRSYGEESPLDPGHGEQSWSVNRRGEFALYQ